MALIRIGESLHCHIPSVQKSARRLLTGNALEREAGRRHLERLVASQVAAGADYLDVNVDDFLAEEGIGEEGSLQLLEQILALIIAGGQGRPPCIDSSAPQVLEWGLQRYQEMSAGRGRPPVINSVSLSRLEPLRLRRDFAFSLIGMLLERADSSAAFTDIAGPEAYHETARLIFARAREAGFAADEIFFDPTVGPLGADMVGYTRRTFEGIHRIRTDSEMAGVHVCLGLSNCSDGLPRRTAINRAYLRVAVEYGADAAILDVNQVTGEDLCDGRILKLIRRVAQGEESDLLSLLVDYAQAHPRPSAPSARPPLPDPFGRSLQDPQKTVYVLEMAPSEANIEQLYTLAEAGRDTPFTFAVTDTPGGNRVPGPDLIAAEVGHIAERQPIVNLSCKSDDRNGLAQRILALYGQGLRHFFAVTGDYPPAGRPNFDFDAVSLLMNMDALRRGLDFPSLLPRSGKALEGLVAGAAISPFKYREADTWGQYLKLWKKRQAGASYFITQLGYDVKKFHELKLYAQRAGMGDVPLIGMVYLLTPQFLKVLNRVHVAGVVIPQDLKDKYRGKLLPKAERARLRRMNFVEFADYQHRFSLRRAALLTDILVRGLDYKGVDLAGVNELHDALEILAIVEELKQRDWRENYEEYCAGDGKNAMCLAPEEAFYLFPDAGDGLLLDGPMQTGERGAYRKTSAAMKRLHRTFFEADGSGHGLLKWAATGAEDGRRHKLLTLFEQAVKSNSLGCEMCGDCRIADLQYQCPEPTQGCAKRLLNGPCGGTDAAGNCEVHPERRCFWGQVIEASLCSGGLDDLYHFQLPKDPTLQHTSSWRNAVLDLMPQALDFGKPKEAQPPS